MKMRRSRFHPVGTLALPILIFASPAAAQNAPMVEEVEEQAGSIGPDDKVHEEKKSDLILAPLPISNPTLGSGAGIAAAMYYNPNDAPRPWVTAVGAGYTSSDSWAAGITHQMSLDDDRFRIRALAGYGDAKLRFYGIGADAGETGASVKLRNRGYLFYGDAQMRLFDHGLLSNLHVGGRVSYQHVRATIRIPVPDDLGIDLDLPAIERSTAVAATGPSFTFDTRNHPFTPSKGVEVTGTWMFGLDALGSDFDHRKLELLSTAFFELDEGSVLAVRKTACSVKGDAPFYDLCLFGQHSDLRGYEAGRYRDKATWAFQIELRQELPKRFGMVAFVGIGGIAPSSGDIWKHSHVLSSGGVGLRYRASEENNVNLRADVAIGEDGATFYFGIGEAF